ncbi:replication initiation and membrane attachment family protein [Salirhabdus sp. Marseille-P4669]|uniref:replication initiation and membrane attachment family protein n=1 Tax=Salirhabdus sp. Marseille-P4669 TaxID=2042310 RepID=UPI0013582448|nr:DnaD domain protein [Salirhabdus sp. Marseille-P4669]
MNERMKNLLPKDSYVIQMHGTCCEDYVLALTHLYQPLIGLESITLYLTLLNDRNVQKGPTTHHTIMNMTNMDLDQFYQTRLKLEAIGLMKTYVDDGELRSYYYVLNPPFSVTEFFNDSMLSILLEHQVGKTHFERLKQNLLSSQKLPTSNLVEKTKSFNDVFSTIQFESQASNRHSTIDVSPKSLDTEAEKIVDFDWIEQALRRNALHPENILTRENKSFITNLVKIYHVDNLTLEKAMLWSINENQELMHEELHEACKDFYAKHFEIKAPKLVNKLEHTKQVKAKDTQPKSKEDKLIEHFENITHREILEDFSQTGYASENEIKMLTSIMLKHGLSQSVMNVLVHYVMQKSDMKLTKNYVEKIATHWARKNVHNAKQAMALAKAESKLYQTWGTRRAGSRKKEVLPDWFKKEQEKEKNEVEQVGKQVDRDFLKEKEELERALRNV